MAAVDPGLATQHPPANAKGATVLAPRIDGGVKVFDLTASVITWQILDGQRMHAYALNDQVPGPTLRLTQGDRVRINVANRLPESTTLHWQGLILPNAMDGPAEVVQPPIPPGGSFMYECMVGQAGTFFYHSHDHNSFVHPMHIHGGPFTVHAVDGIQLAPTRPLRSRHHQCRLGATLRRRVDRPRARQMAAALPHSAPHHHDNAEQDGGGLMLIVDVT